MRAGTGARIRLAVYKIVTLPRQTWMDCEQVYQYPSLHLGTRNDTYVLGVAADGGGRASITGIWFPL